MSQKANDMCYIMGVRVSLEEFKAYKRQQTELKQLMAAKLLYQPAKRGFDYGDWPVIKPTWDGKSWDIAPMEWGLLHNGLKTDADVHRFRHGYKDDAGKYIKPITTLNARGEELLDKAMFSDAARHRRVLVLASHFFEHQHVPQIGKRGGILETPEKVPYCITLPGKTYFPILGIYNTWTDQNTGETKDTLAIVTTVANSLMSAIHNSEKRMPVIATKEIANEWRNPGLPESRIREIATYQYPSELMKAHRVSKDFLTAADPTAQVITMNKMGLAV